MLLTLGDDFIQRGREPLVVQVIVSVEEHHT
jgi:hypothetical protein